MFFTGADVFIIKTTTKFLFVGVVSGTIVSSNVVAFVSGAAGGEGLDDGALGLLAAVGSSCGMAKPPDAIASLRAWLPAAVSGGGEVKLPHDCTRPREFNVLLRKYVDVVEFSADSHPQLPNLQVSSDEQNFSSLIKCGR